MKRTDYSKIAPCYDNNPLRHKIGKDISIQKAIETFDGETIKVLDIACGTGNYLFKQQEYYATAPIQWYGVDYSNDMLAVARSKINFAELQHANAEQLPFQDSCFHYISCNNAFHHFMDKDRAIEEMSRVVKQKGTIRIGSIAPSYMDHSWVYTYFPETVVEDKKRFWSHDMISQAFEANELQARVDVSYECEQVPLRILYEEAKGRDASQLHIISETAYQKGMDRMEYELSREPDVCFKRSFAFMVITAVKKIRMTGGSRRTNAPA
jgi:ubiquinone/menaquinone biosynthesis C-methylase UbiE